MKPKTLFIISNSIGAHPMALLHPERVTDPAVRAALDARAVRFRNCDHDMAVAPPGLAGRPLRHRRRRIYSRIG